MFFEKACETQLKLMPIGMDNLMLIPEETRKIIYEASRKAPEGSEAAARHFTVDNKERVIQVKIMIY